MNLYSFSSRVSGAVLDLYPSMKDLAEHVAAQGDVEADQNYERYVGGLARYAQEDVARLNTEIETIDPELSQSYVLVQNPTQEWTNYPSLDWRGRRIAQRVEYVSDECEESIDTVVEALSDYAGIRRANLEGGPRSSNPEDEPDWSRILDQAFEEFSRAVSTPEGCSLESLTTLSNRFLSECGIALEAVVHGHQLAY